jgi:hypothetical protein
MMTAKHFNFAAMTYAEKCSWTLLGLCYLGLFLTPVIFRGFLPKGDTRLGGELIVGVMMAQASAVIGLLGGGVLIYRKRWESGVAILLAGLLAGWFGRLTLLLAMLVFG